MFASATVALCCAKQGYTPNLIYLWPFNVLSVDVRKQICPFDYSLV